jgi:D-alanyl-D-alanine carboxypeptidase
MLYYPHVYEENVQNLLSKPFESVFVLIHEHEIYETTEDSSRTARFLAAIDKAKLPDYISSKLQAQYAKNPAFIADLQACLEGDPYLRKLVDKQNPLPKNYAPDDLVKLEEGSYRIKKDDLFLRSSAATALSEMAAAAQANRVILTIASAYRSYNYQIGIYGWNVQQIGKKAADIESASPGFSQHQTGTTVDFSPIHNFFAKTNAGHWLAANASRFGWSLSYPLGYESVTGYRWESWHYRYVGKELAAFIDKYFDGVQQYALQFIQAWLGENF